MLTSEDYFALRVVTENIRINDDGP